MPQKPYVLDGDECRAAREQLKWSQAELATKTGCSARTIGGFETGQRAAHINLLKAIRQELEVAGKWFSRPADPRP